MKTRHTGNIFKIIGLSMVTSLLCGAPVFAGANPSVTSYQVGEAVIYPVNDQPVAMPVKIFSGNGVTQKEIAALAQADTVPAGMRGFLIKRGDEVILVDAGSGVSAGGKLLENLQKTGTQPEDVTLLLLTHLHPDHVGGIIQQGKAVFPNAVIMVSDREKEFWFDDQAMQANAGLKANFQLARKALGVYGDKVKTFACGDMVAEDIKAFDASGHTPGHTAFLLESGDKGMLFWGDIVHGAALQFPDPRICASYDMDKAKAVSARREIMLFAAEEGFPVAGAHLPDPGIGSVSPGKDKNSFTYTTLNGED